MSNLWALLQTKSINVTAAALCLIQQMTHRCSECNECYYDLA